MKINDIKKDYRLFVDGMVNVEGSVFTAREIYDECQKNNIKATYAMIKSYVKREHRYFLFKSTLYFGTKKNIENLRKIKEKMDKAKKIAGG